MIVLKILLIILLVILGLILLVLILPVGGDLSFIDGKVKFKVRLWRLNVMDSDGGGVLGWLKKHKKKKKPKKLKNSKDKPKNDFDGSISDIEEDEELTNGEASVQTLNESIPEVEAASVTDDNSSNNEEINEISDDEIAEEQPDKGKKKKKSKKNAEGDAKEEKTELTDKIDFILSTIDVAWSPLKRIFKGFRFSELYIDFIIANEDAYKCAITYGRLCGIIYNGLAQISRLFTVRLKTVDIQPGFGLNKSRWDASFSLDFRAGTVVIAGFAFLITFIFKVFLPGKFKKRKAKKSAAVQK